MPNNGFYPLDMEIIPFLDRIDFYVDTANAGTKSLIRVFEPFLHGREVMCDDDDNKVLEIQSDEVKGDFTFIETREL